MKRFKKIIILFILPLLTFVVALPVMPLMDPDEGRYALIPREMNERGDYITPHLKGVVYLEKPPLVYWMEAMFFHGFGESELTARLPAGLCAWGLVVLLYLMGRRLKDDETGLLSAAVFSCSLLPFSLARLNILDMPLTFFITLAVWAGFRFLTTDKKPLWLYGLYFFSACAFLTKGLIGVVFPFAVLVCWLLWIGNWRRIFSLFSPVGMFIWVIFIGPWLWGVQRNNPEFMEFFFIREHFLRYTTTMHERGEPFYFFLPILLAGALPWWFYLPRAFAHTRPREIWERERKENSFKLLIVWILWPLFFFSFSSSKLIPYILPSFPPLAVLFGFLFREGEGPKKVDGRSDIWPLIPSFLFMLILLVPFVVPSWKNIPPLSWVFYVIPVLIQLVIIYINTTVKISGLNNRYIMISVAYSLYLLSLLPVVGHYLAPGKSAYQLAQAVMREVPAGELIYQFRTIEYGVDFYTRRRTAIVDDQGELAAGVKRLSAEERKRYFPVSTEFIAELQKKKRLYVITDRQEKLTWFKEQGIGLNVLWNNGNYYMFQAYVKN